MTASATHLHHTWARLPSGEVMEPGVSEMCSGPNPYGGCPRAEPGQELPCAGATWFLDGDGGQPAWHFSFRPGTSICPISVLNPLGLPMTQKATGEAQA